MKKHLLFFALYLLSFSLFSIDLNTSDFGKITGNFSTIAQYYQTDSTINAIAPDEKIGVNSYLNLIYNRKYFEAGIRYEVYQNALLGFSNDYKGNGLTYKYARYKRDHFDITVGNFYEQFGNGQILRTYFDPGFGIDNSIEGARIKYSHKGLDITGLIGQQRNYFDKGAGIVRGGDFNIDVGEILKNLDPAKLGESSFFNASRLSIGGSVVSKFQPDDNSLYTLPKNVLAYSGRFSYNYKTFNLSSEYTFKHNDPSADNDFSYRSGQNLSVSTSYYRRGFGINIAARTLDNMFFRSDRNNNSRFPELFINFIPTLTKQHTYNLLATLYPYAIQYGGEISLQGDLIYKFKKNTPLGGKYGTSIQLNASIAYVPDSIGIDDGNAARKLYKVNLFKLGETKLWHDINIEVSKKLSKKVKTKFVYQNLFYNQDIIEGKPGVENILAHTGIADILYKINKKYAVRTELQALFTEEDKGNWATILIELTHSPNWFLSIQNQYNYGNKKIEDRVIYPVITAGYIHKSTRFSISYGKQREGLFCSGGVCRVVPASSGVTVSLTSRF